MPGVPDRPFGQLGGTLRAKQVSTEHFVQALDWLTEKKSAKVQHLTKAFSS